MTDQNTPETDNAEEEIENIRVEFASRGEGNVFYGSQVFGLVPGLVATADFDDETKELVFDVSVYGTNDPAGFLDSLVSVLANIRDSVALEAERVALEREQEEDGAESSEDE